MDRSVYATCLWPGLTRLWFRGDLQGLLPAVVTALALNGLIILRFIYPQMLNTPGGDIVRWGGWFLVLAWLVAVVRGYHELPLVLAPRSVQRKVDRFPEAQSEFLKGNWLQAEQALREIIRIEERDAPSLLMLAAVYRQTERLELASKTLGRLGRLEAGDAWYLEMRAERQRIVRARSGTDIRENPETV